MVHVKYGRKYRIVTLERAAAALALARFDQPA
jgi:hypothetical protein